MSDYAEMVAEGMMCRSCGAFMEDARGAPRNCPECEARKPKKRKPNKRAVR